MIAQRSFNARAILGVCYPSAAHANAGLAGSVLTLLTGMPGERTALTAWEQAARQRYAFSVVSEISDDKTGSYGRVNVVLPRASRSLVWLLAHVGCPLALN